MYHHYLPDSFIELQQELLQPCHADIQEALNKQEDKSIEVLMAEIAVQLQIILNGDYMLPDLAKMLVTQLKKKRMGDKLILLRSYGNKKSDGSEF